MKAGDEVSKVEGSNPPTFTFQRVLFSYELYGKVSSLWNRNKKTNQLANEGYPKLTLSNL